MRPARTILIMQLSNSRVHSNFYTIIYKCIYAFLLSLAIKYDIIEIL